MSEDEVRNLKKRFEDELECLVDVDNRLCNRAHINALEMVLND